MIGGKNKIELDLKRRKGKNNKRDKNLKTIGKMFKI